MVVSADKAGRKVVYVPRCKSAAPITSLAQGADVLICDAAVGLPTAATSSPAHPVASSSNEAARGEHLAMLAAEVDALYLAITGITNRYI